MSGNGLNTWLIIPHDPLVFRDGKPFTAVPGARAQSVPFPFPSTVAGAVRTRSGAIQHGGVFPAGDQQIVSRVLGYRIVGPFLYSLGRHELLLPAPRDAFFATIEPDNEREARLIPLQPRSRAFPNVQTNLPDDLQLVTLVEEVDGKAHPKAPHFWRWSHAQVWLETPCVHQSVALSEWGLSHLPMDIRIHVSIDPGLRTAREGALFQTGGLTFVHAPVHERRHPSLAEAEEFALLVQTDAHPFAAGVDALGGERRLVMWQRAEVSLPACPDSVREAILSTRRGRLMLVTPACFNQGFRPTWVLEHPSGVKLRVVAAAVGRPVHVSGWDYDKQRPKETRRLAPAGSVYFFEITQGDRKAIERFVETVWMQPISDDGQDRRDGFGVALLGTWNEQED